MCVCICIALEYSTVPDTVVQVTSKGPSDVVCRFSTVLLRDDHRTVDMRINMTEAHLILYHISDECTFGAEDEELLRVLVTEEEGDVALTPTELWGIIRGVPVTGDLAQVYTNLKRKAAAELASMYGYQFVDDPVDTMLKDVFNDRED